MVNLVIATRYISTLLDRSRWFFCAGLDVLMTCTCAAVSDPCSTGCTFMGPVAGGRSLAIPDNAHGWPLVSFLLSLFVRMHPLQA